MRLRATARGRPCKRPAISGQCIETGWRLRQDGGRFFADVVINVLRGPSGSLRGFSHVAERYPEREEIVRTDPAVEK